MLRAALSAALISCAAMAAAGSAISAPVDEMEVFDNGEIRGPAYDDSTTCAAVFLKAANFLGEADANYEMTRSTGVAWLGWSRMVAQEPGRAMAVTQAKMGRMARAAKFGQ